jgi:hypothetical protein
MQVGMIRGATRVHRFQSCANPEPAVPRVAWTGFLWLVFISLFIFFRIGQFVGNLKVNASLKGGHVAWDFELCCPVEQLRISFGFVSA